MVKWPGGEIKTLVPVECEPDIVVYPWIIEEMM
jgi:hypothetical protein